MSNRKQTPKSDKFTQADAERLHNKWRDILGIRIPGKVELVDTLGDNLAEVTPMIRRNRYTIKLSNPDYRTGCDIDLDDDMAHELTHVLSWFNCIQKDRDPVFEEAYEQFVDHMAGVLVRLHRGQK